MTRFAPQNTKIATQYIASFSITAKRAFPLCTKSPLIENRKPSPGEICLHAQIKTKFSQNFVLKQKNFFGQKSVFLDKGQ